MTGARPDTIGVIENSVYFRDKNPDIVTLTQHFIAHGYEAAHCGKIFHKPAFADLERSWSRKPAYDKVSFKRPTGGFALAENQAIVRKNNEILEAKYGVGIGKTGLVQGPAFERADVPDQTYRDGYNTDLAIATMKEMAQNPDKPFFLGLGFYKPHLNFIAPDKYWKLYDDIDLPQATHEEGPVGGAETGLHASFELRVRHGIPKSGPIEGELADTLMHAYLACVSYIDAQVGRMVEALEEEGLRDNTIIIVWATMVGTSGRWVIWGKATNYEIATRVPLMIWTPEMGTRGATTEALGRTGGHVSDTL